MRLAITADTHLTTMERHPARFETLQNILADMRANQIELLIIAGDLFDAHRQNYSDFEKLCRRPENEGIKIFVIPGNHDPLIDDRKIVAGNLQIFSEPTVIEFNGRTFFFLPYQQNKSMGEVLAAFRDQLPVNDWVLISHGDWADGLHHPNPTEPGVHMPLTRRDIEIFKPARVFLGHIHAAMDEPPVHYVGSPCGLNITETGRRRCLLYDTDTNQIEKHRVSTPVLFFDESFIIVPAGDETALLRAQIDKRMKQWSLSPEEKAKTKLRVEVRGYSSDRSALDTVLQEAFEGFSFYKHQKPNIDDVSNSDDVERHYIAQQVSSNLETLDFAADENAPTDDEILLEALHMIYR